MRLNSFLMLLLFLIPTYSWEAILEEHFNSPTPFPPDGWTSTQYYYFNDHANWAYNAGNTFMPGGHAYGEAVSHSASSPHVTPADLITCYITLEQGKQNYLHFRYYSSTAYTTGMYNRIYVEDNGVPLYTYWIPTSNYNERHKAILIMPAISTTSPLFKVRFRVEAVGSGPSPAEGTFQVDDVFMAYVTKDTVFPPDAEIAYFIPINRASVAQIVPESLSGIKAIYR